MRLLFERALHRRAPSRLTRCGKLWRRRRIALGTHAHEIHRQQAGCGRVGAKSQISAIAEPLSLSRTIVEGTIAKRRRQDLITYLTRRSRMRLQGLVE